MYLQDKLYQATLGLDDLTIVHCGGHTGEEAAYYDGIEAENVLWVEANPDLMAQLTANVSRFPGQKAVQALLSDVDGADVVLNIANNTQCSSLLALKDHAEVYPHYRYVGGVTLKTKRLDTLLEELKDEDYSVLMMDVQGAEAKVLGGCPHLLAKVSVVYAEINFREMYASCPLAAELDALLGKAGFARWATYDTGCGWGDAIYRRGM